MTSSTDLNVQRLRRLDACAVSDALDRLQLAGTVTGIALRSTGPGGASRIAGRAVTMKVGPGKPPEGPPRHLGCSAVELAGPDDVIVVEQRTGLDAAAWGGILSRAARHRGIAGTLVDGPTRDVEEANRIGYPVYARSTTARTARGRIHEAECQTTIRFGDTEVSPGDYVAADRSGCVVIAAARIADVLARAEDILKKSDDMAAAVERGAPVSKVMGGAYETMLEKK